MEILLKSWVKSCLLSDPPLVGWAFHWSANGCRLVQSRPLPCPQDLIECPFRSKIWSLPLLGIFSDLRGHVESQQAVPGLPRAAPSACWPTSLFLFLRPSYTEPLLQVWQGTSPPCAFYKHHLLPGVLLPPLSGWQTRNSSIFHSNISAFLKGFLSFLGKPTFSLPHKLKSFEHNTSMENLSAMIVSFQSIF